MIEFDQYQHKVVLSAVAYYKKREREEFDQYLAKHDPASTSVADAMPEEIKAVAAEAETAADSTGDDTPAEPASEPPAETPAEEPAAEAEVVATEEPAVEAEVASTEEPEVKEAEAESDSDKKEE